MRTNITYKKRAQMYACARTQTQRQGVEDYGNKCSRFQYHDQRLGPFTLPLQALLSCLIQLRYSLSSHRTLPAASSPTSMSPCVFLAQQPEKREKTPPIFDVRPPLACSFRGPPFSYCIPVLLELESLKFYPYAWYCWNHLELILFLNSVQIFSSMILIFFSSFLACLHCFGCHDSSK